MNNDLISRSELKKEIERLKQNLEKWVAHTECDTTKALVRISLYEEFIDIIDIAPTVSESIEPRIEYGTDGQPYRLFMSGCADMRGDNNG